MGRNARLGIVAIVIAGLVTFLYNNSSKKDPKDVAEPTKSTEPKAITSKVIVSKINMEPWITDIRKNLVEIKAYPEELIPPDAAQTIDDVENKVPKAPIYAGEIISLKRVVDKTLIKEEGIDKNLIPPGYRAISLSVDTEAGTSGFVSQEDIVDILTVYHDPRHGRRVSKMLLQNIKVLAVGNLIEDRLEASESSQITGSRRKTNVVLLVKPSEATTIKHLASIKAQYRLILKNPRDKAPIRTPGFTEAELFGEDPKARADKELARQMAQAENPSIMVIRGAAMGKEALGPTAESISTGDSGKMGGMTGASQKGISNMQGRVFN